MMEKKFPPRVWLDSIDIEEAEFGSYHWTNKAPDDTKFDVEYLSKQEHDHLMQELQAKLDKAVEALEFYSGNSDDSLDWDYVNNPAVIQDKGKTARQTLKEIRGEK